nr:CPBP family glutamic-type intramembrane protease [Rhodanobacter sp. PCA2]
MLAVVLRRLEGGRLPAGLAVLLCALVFALMHTPNGVLMQLCLLAELWWAWCFRRSRALLPVAAAHAACALVVEASLAGGLLRSLEVSARFFL